MIKGASMFASAGIGETYFKDSGVDIVVANELIEKRALFYSETHEGSNVVVGDIRDKDIKKKFMSYITEDVKLLIATPPCQGLSNLGKNRSLDDRLKDKRNFLIFDVLDVIDNNDFDYIMIENVPGFVKMYFYYEDQMLSLEDILKIKYSEKYEIEIRILNAKNYGVPQSRPRAIIKLYKKTLKWGWPSHENEITLRESIGHLPSVESNQDSGIYLHKARKHSENHILWMKHTPTGETAHDNCIYYPQKKDGTRVKGYRATYKRMSWDRPAPAVTMRSDAISSQENVHPGNPKSDGTYSDARVLTLRELFIVSSLPEDWKIPEWATDTFIRQIVGEAVPPLLSAKIVKKIGED